MQKRGGKEREVASSVPVLSEPPRNDSLALSLLIGLFVLGSVFDSWCLIYR